MRITEVPTKLLQKELNEVNDFLSSEYADQFGFSRSQAEEQSERIERELKRRKIEVII